MQRFFIYTHTHTPWAKTGSCTLLVITEVAATTYAYTQDVLALVRHNYTLLTASCDMPTC